MKPTISKEYRIIYYTIAGNVDLFWTTASSVDEAIQVLYEMCDDVSGVKSSICII